MYVVLEVGGKQYRASVGDSLLVEKLDQKVGDVVLFDKILLIVSDNDITLGKPYIEHTSVEAKILSQERGEKIRVSKFKAKVRYRKTIGHRQYLTRLNITKINFKKRSSSTKVDLDNREKLE